MRTSPVSQLTLTVARRAPSRKMSLPPLALPSAKKRSRTRLSPMSSAPGTSTSTARRGEKAATVELVAAIAEMDDERLINVMGRGRRPRVAELGGDLVGRSPQLIAGAGGIEVGKHHGKAQRHDAQGDDQLQQGEAQLACSRRCRGRAHHCKANSLTLTMAPITDRMRPPTMTPIRTVRIGVSKLVTRSSWRCSAAS